MTDRRVTIIDGEVGSSDAIRIATAATGDDNAFVERAVCYPYYWFEARCTLPSLAGRQAMSLTCLVDAINGIGATADEFQTKEEVIRAGDELAERIDDDEAAEIARRTISHTLSRKVRTIASFDVELEPCGVIHKRYWIIRTSGARLMVDSSTGHLHPLKLRAA